MTTMGVTRGRDVTRGTQNMKLDNQSNKAGMTKLETVQEVEAPHTTTSQTNLARHVESGGTGGTKY